MEYVYAALILHKLKKEITEENVTSIVKASGAELNEAKVKSLVHLWPMLILKKQ